MRSFLAVLLALVCLGIPGRAAVVHHFAETLSEVDYNAETKSFEWALSMSPSDLEWILGRRARKDVNLEKTEGVDQLIQDYLGEVVRAWAPDGTELKLAWVGKEVEVKRVWLYFEFALPKGVEGPERVKLSNRVLMRWERDQVNSVSLRAGELSRSIALTRKAPTHVLERIEEPEKTPPEGETSVH